MATGRCMCAAVRYEVATEALRDVFDCHCHRCRQWTGHHMAATGAPSAEVAVVDPDASLRWYSPADTVEYGFCGRCGSSMFWRTTARPAWLSICAGTIDQPSGLRTTASWWTSEHADYHSHEPHLVEHPLEG